VEAAGQEGETMTGTSLAAHGHWTRALLYLLERSRIGSIEVMLPGGGRHSFAGDLPGPHAEVELRDEIVARRLLTGGDVDPRTLVSEEYLHALERKHFCALLDNPKSQERIMGMLSTGKPVRN